MAVLRAQFMIAMMPQLMTDAGALITGVLEAPSMVDSAGMQFCVVRRSDVLHSFIIGVISFPTFCAALPLSGGQGLEGGLLVERIIFSGAAWGLQYTCSPN